MKKQSNGPSVIEDLGALAELYRRVFWMMGQRLQHPREWPPEPTQIEPQLMSEPDLRVVRLHRHN